MKRIFWKKERSKPRVIFLTLLSLLMVGAGDYLTDPELSFTLFYFTPVFVITWSLNRKAGIITSVCCAVIWTVVDYFHRPYLTLWIASWNISVNSAIFVLFTITLSRIREDLLEQRRLHLELKEALAEVKKLSGLLPLCARCKRIQDKQGNWHPLEVYLAGQSEADFSHGICPDCLNKQLQDRK